jgi:hypothetical protein
MPIKSTTIARKDARRWGFRTMASIDNPKASKATTVGYLNAILYMAPADSGGDWNACVFAGACKELCLGVYSGQAGIGDPDKNAAIRARKGRVRAFMRERQLFLQYVVRDIQRLKSIAHRMGLRLCYRFNGSTDVGVPLWLLALFPDVTFIDYTKNPNRFSQYLAGAFPANYSMTFSRDVHNERLADRFLAQGGNVAVVFAERPATWHGHTVVDGDRHDVRTPDLDGRGVVIGLTPKGRKAKKDQTGFVVRQAA